MPNEMTLALFHSEYPRDFQNDDYLQHYGILGMHWGIRRYQPYGEGGYDPDHEGKNIGLAARLAGHTGSYSDAIKRGSSLGNRAKAAASSFGKRAGSAVNEGLERLKYANDRMGEGIKNAGRKATASADRAKKAIGEAVLDAKFFATRYTSQERRAVTDFYKNKVQDSLRGAMGKVKTGSKEFARNAAMTAAIFGGALDPRNEGFTKVQARADVRSGLSGNSASLYSGWYEHESRMNPGQKRVEWGRGSNTDKHADALDLAGRLVGSKYDQLSRTGKAILQGPSSKSHTTSDRPIDRSSIGTYDPRSAIRLSTSGLSPINQKSTAPRWKGNDPATLEARRRVASGDLSLLGMGRRATDSAIKAPYRDTDRRSDAYWKDKQARYIHYMDTSFDPSDPAVYGSKVGNMTNKAFERRLERTGVKLSEINQTPASRAVSIGGSASSQELAKRLLGL